MAVKADITVPLGLVVASVATFIGNAAMHYWVYGNSPRGFFAFRFFQEPAIVILVVLIPAATVLILRLIRNRRTVQLRHKAAYGWLVGALTLLGLLTTLAFSGIDTYWLGYIFFFMPPALLISSALGIAAMVVLTRVVGHRQGDTPTTERLQT